MSIKSDLLDKINKKAKRRQDLSEEIAQRNKNVESFIAKLLDELDTAIAATANSSLFNTPRFKAYYVGSIEQRIKTLDSNAAVEVSWSEDEAPDTMPRVNGILVKWSSEYQKSNNCEEQLFIDVTSLLLK